MRAITRLHGQTKTGRQERATSFTQVRGVVVSGTGGALSVDTGEGVFPAKRAVSCLVEPIAGDQVLLATSSDDQSYVLAVLEREPGAPAQLAFEGDVTVKVNQGQFIVAAEEGIALATSKQVTVASREVSVTAAEGSVVLRQLAYLGDRVQAEVGKVKHVGAVMETVLERVSQRVKRSFRVVEEIDQLKAEQIDYSAKLNVHLHGKNALVSAEDLVKVDGEQIQLG